MLLQALMVLFVSPMSQAQLCGELFPISQERFIEFSQERPLVMPQTEVFRRNNDIGMQQMGEIRLKRWFEIQPSTKDSYNFVGIHADGRIYQVIDWHGQRRFARLLSGEKVYEDIFLIDNQVLAAVDKNGVISFYSPRIWNKSPRNGLIKRGAAIWAGVTSLFTTGLYFVSPESVHWLSPYVWAVGGTTAMQSAFVMLFRYERLNTYPDGFVPSQLVARTPAEIRDVLSQLTPELMDRYLLRDDLQVPDRSLFAPRLHEDALEDIRHQ